MDSVVQSCAVRRLFSLCANLPQAYQNIDRTSRSFYVAKGDIKLIRVNSKFPSEVARIT